MLAPGRGDRRARSRASGVVRGKIRWNGMGARSFISRERSGEGFCVVRWKRSAVRRGRSVGRMVDEFTS